MINYMLKTKQGYLKCSKRNTFRDSKSGCMEGGRMKEIMINIDDYLTNEEIKEIIGEEIKENIRINIRDNKSITTFLNNLSYKYVWEIIEDEVEKKLDGIAKEVITEKVVEIIKKLSSYDVFRSGDYFNKKSIAQKILDDAVEENKEILQKKVKEILEKEYLGIQAREEMAEIVSNAIYELLSVKRVEE